MEINIPEHIKRKMKGSRRYKDENRDKPKAKPKVLGYRPTKKPNVYARIKKFIKRVVGRM